jgi:competence protein ComEC
MVLGASVLQHAARLPAIVWLAGAVVAALLLAGSARRFSARAAGTHADPLAPARRARWWAPLATIVAAALFAWAWAGWLAHGRIDARLPQALEGRDLTVVGVVSGLPQPFERGVRFVLRVESSEPAGVDGPIALAWYNGWTPEEFQAVLPVRAGERWRLTVRLKRPHTNANPHGFDYEAWLLEQDIRATGSVRPKGAHSRVDALAGTPRAWLDRTRDGIRERLWNALPEGRYVGVLIALVVGDQRATRAEDWATFNRTGVGHLMSISGLHVTMIASLAALTTAWLWRRAERLVLLCPVRKAAVVAGAIAAAVYCALAGFGIPAQRTLYMLLVAAIALWLDRAQSASRVLAIALAVVLLVDPWAVMAPGFWLSFAAVAMIFYALRAGDRQHWLAAWARTQWAITIGLVPLTLALFQQVSLVSPLANAVAIPVVSFVVTPLALIAAAVPIDTIAVLAQAVFALLMPLLEWLAHLPIAVWQQHAPPWWSIALAIVAVAWLLAPAGVPGRIAALPLFAPLLLVAPPLPVHGTAWVDVLDVGQGLAVVVRTANHTLVYDAGPAYSVEADAGNRVVVPFLRGEGVRDIDRMVITHLDNDHSGGAASVARLLPVGILLSSLPDGHPAQQRPAYRVPCRAGQTWRWDGVEFAVLHPSTAARFDDAELEPLRARRASRTNSQSCVVRIATGERALLLTGDIEANDELALLRSQPSALRADVVLVPHHGSRTSSTPEFVEAVAPRWALVAAGYRNRFGHPRADVVQRYQERGTEVLRTDAGGALRIELGADTIRATTFRATAPRYWR